jgi:very-short-patch-repair endonuclease
LTLGGRIRWDRILHLNGGGREWGGRIDYTLEGRSLHLRSRQLKVKELMKVLGVSPMLQGRAASELQYNLEKERGTLRITMKQARFVKGSLTTVASRILKYDLSKERFKTVRFQSRIEGPKVVFDFIAKSQRLELRIKDGKIDREKNRIDAMLTLLDRGKRYKLRLRGPLDRPTITPVVTEAVVERVEKEMKKHQVEQKVKKAIPKELREEGNPVSDFFKKLF